MFLVSASADDTARGRPAAQWRADFDTAGQGMESPSDMALEDYTRLWQARDNSVANRTRRLMEDDPDSVLTHLHDHQGRCFEYALQQARTAAHARMARAD